MTDRAEKERAEWHRLWLDTRVELDKANAEIERLREEDEFIRGELEHTATKYLISLDNAATLREALEQIRHSFPCPCSVIANETLAATEEAVKRDD